MSPLSPFPRRAKGRLASRAAILASSNSRSSSISPSLALSRSVSSASPSVGRVARLASPAATKVSRHPVRVAAVTPSARERISRSSPRNRRSTASRLRWRDMRPPRPKPTPPEAAVSVVIVTLPRITSALKGVSANREAQHEALDPWRPGGLILLRPLHAPSAFLSQRIKRSGSRRDKEVAMLANDVQVSCPKEHPMSKIVAAGLSAFLITASSLAYAQVSTGPAQGPGPGQAGPAQERLSDAEFKTLTDRPIELVKFALQLTPDQAKYWRSVEEG